MDLSVCALWITWFLDTFALLMRTQQFNCLPLDLDSTCANIYLCTFNTIVYSNNSHLIRLRNAESFSLLKKFSFEWVWVGWSRFADVCLLRSGSYSIQCWKVCNACLFESKESLQCDVPTHISMRIRKWCLMNGWLDWFRLILMNLDWLRVN